MHISRINLWHFYSIGAEGESWSVRQMVDEDDDGTTVIYKTITGPAESSAGHITRQEFASWAKYEVELVDNEWRRVERQTSSVSFRFVNEAKSLPFCVLIYSSQ